jgi:hypothetical protein
MYIKTISYSSTHTGSKLHRSFALIPGAESNLLNAGILYNIFDE